MDRKATWSCRKSPPVSCLTWTRSTPAVVLSDRPDVSALRELTGDVKKPERFRRGVDPFVVPLVSAPARTMSSETTCSSRSSYAGKAGSCSRLQKWNVGGSSAPTRNLAQRKPREESTRGGV